jgi:hypothetical protein
MKDYLGITDQISFQVKKEKEIIRDGKVGILFSPGFGVGWYTWHGVDALLRDPEVIHLVECRFKAPEEERDYYTEKIIEYCEIIYGTDYYYGGAGDLEIEWIELGDKFRITEYDGSEGIEYLTELRWMEA